MNPTKHTANTASTSKTGPFAALRGLLQVKGTGAPKMWLLPVLVLASLAFTAAPALAAIAPEAPMTEKVTNNTTGTSVTFNGTLNPKHPFGEEGEKYKFYYEESASGCRGGAEEKFEPELALPAGGAQGEAVSLEIRNLKPKTTYTYCVWVRNEEFEAAEGAPETFETPAAVPAITGASIVGLTSTEATLTAAINPYGELTTYRVEYEQGKFTAEQSLPVSNIPFEISEKLSGLTPNTKYEVRLLAYNEAGEGEATVTFTTSEAFVAKGAGSSSGCTNTTFSGFSPTLPDCRAAELVSPASEIGETYDPGGTNGHEEDVTTPRPFRAAAEGSAVAFIADPGPLGGDGSSAKGKGNEYIARRGAASGPQGWEVANITPPVGVGEISSDEREYESFSSDLSVGTLLSEQPLLAAHPSPQGPDGCSALYAHNERPGVSEFQALFTQTLTPRSCGINPGPESDPPVGEDIELLFAGETADQTQRFFQTPAPLVAPAVAGTGFGGNLYDSSSGGLSVVNVLPGGTVDPNATYGGPSGLHRNAPDFSNAISADGSRVFWSAVETVEGAEESERAARPLALYAREDPTSPSATTVQLDAPQAGATGTAGKGQFWTASSDGSEVFFTDCNKLTAGSTANSSEGCESPPGTSYEVRFGNDLYEYDFNRPVGERLIDLTEDHNPADPLGADVQGVIGQGESSGGGSYIYFVAGGALTDERNGRGETPSTQECGLGGGCNLYEEHNYGSEWEPPRFITRLATIDNNMTEGINDPVYAKGEDAGDWMPNLGSRTAEVSPDGRHLVFESTAALTGYPGGQIYLWSAEVGKLSCVSCAPTGAPPIATEFPAYLPVSSSNTFMHRWMNAAGTEVFFDSSQPLVQGDSNGTQDVYEWERPAEPGETDNTCTAQASSAVTGGCTSLLSGGESTDLSFFVDTDESGEDVFLTHRGQLDGAGPRGEKVHLFDIRVNGGFPDISLACTGTGCQGVPPAAPSFATPASVTFSGAGNLSPTPTKVVVKSLTRAQKLSKALQGCKKDRRKQKRIACEKAARKRYGSVKSKAKSKSGKRSAKQGGRKS